MSRGIDEAGLNWLRAGAAAALAGSMALMPHFNPSINSSAPRRETKRGKTRLPNYRKKGPGRKHRKGPGPTGLCKYVYCPVSVLESANSNRFKYMHSSARSWARYREAVAGAQP